MLKIFSYNEFIEKFYIANRIGADPNINFLCIKPISVGLCSGAIVKMTGYYYFKNGDRRYFKDGIICSPMEVFDYLTDEEKEKVVWELDKWR